ncbi:MAG: Sulfate transport system permease protein CysW [Candidatus Erwinia impunctatus]|nr:Sulfate transport system permease protein CysW [Culicoides impunctatus]
MATRRQPVILIRLLPGTLCALLLVSSALLAIFILWYYAPAEDHSGLWEESCLWHVVGFSFWQASLSTLVATLPAVPLARALYRRRFIGRTWLLRLCAMTLILPVLVAVFGLLSIYGQQGWLAHLCRAVGLPYTFSPYGLQGILLAHLFFNLPLATRLLLQALQQIPVEQRQLAAQLGLKRWQHFIIVEWPWLRRQLLSSCSLIFILCFTSFATVLALGGGPQATTLELAIFQSLSFDYDPARAAQLALLQMGCCLSLVVLSQWLKRSFKSGERRQLGWVNPQDSRRAKGWDILLISLLCLLLLPPLLAIVFDGINRHFPVLMQQTTLWQAIVTSLWIALSAGLLALTVTMMLLWSSRELQLRGHLPAARLITLSGSLILAMPGIVLASAIFLFCSATLGLPDNPALLVIIINALMAVPYAMKVLESPMNDSAERFDRLCLSLGITGWKRLRLIELRALRQPLCQALAFACVLSVGDFGVIALFGSENFQTLPFYLYQQIGAYRSENGAVTALLLLLLCLLLLTVIEKISGSHADA